MVGSRSGGFVLVLGTLQVNPIFLIREVNMFTLLSNHNFISISVPPEFPLLGRRISNN